MGLGLEVGETAGSSTAVKYIPGRTTATTSVEKKKKLRMYAPKKKHEKS